MLSRRYLLLILVMMAGWLDLVAQPSEVLADSLVTEKIKEEAKDSGFIKAYCLVMGEGPASYSVCGHVALRLVCAAKGLDYCFTFEVDMHTSSRLDVLMRSGKAGFVYVPTRMFLRQYREEGRSVTQYELNLLPEQKQNLWRTLDEQVKGGPQWTFDVQNINCVSMANFAINTAIQPSRMACGQQSRVLLYENEEQLKKTLSQAPWYSSFFVRFLLLGTDGQKFHTEDLLLPRVYGDVLTTMYIIDETGQKRPLIKGNAQALVQQTYKSSPQWASLVLAVVLFVACICIVVWIIRKRKNKNIVKHKKG